MSAGPPTKPPAHDLAPECSGSGQLVFADAQPPFRCDACGRSVDVVSANGATKGERAIVAHARRAPDAVPALDDLTAPMPGTEVRRLLRRALTSADLIEVPDVAYRAALALLSDLVNEGDDHAEGCPFLCVRLIVDGAWVHEDTCVASRARKVREALDYSDPVAQARALEQLRRLAGEAR